MTHWTDLTYKAKDRDGSEVIVCKAANARERTITVIPGDRGVALRGDLKFSFKEHRPLLAGRGKDIFHFWINTFFIDGNYLRIPKMEIDRAYKDKRFGIDFSVDLHFASADGARDAMDAAAIGSSGSLRSLSGNVNTSTDGANGRSSEGAASASSWSSSPQPQPSQVDPGGTSSSAGHGDTSDDYSSSSSDYDDDNDDETDEISGKSPESTTALHCTAQYICVANSIIHPADPDQLLEDLEEEYRSHTLS